MAAVWSDQARYTTWAQIELEVMKSQGRSGLVDKDLWRILELVLIPDPEDVA